MKADTIKMRDMPLEIAVLVFQMLNPQTVSIEKFRGHNNLLIVTELEPKLLTYPEGWYYSKGCFTNKRTSSTGFYKEVLMVKSNGSLWKKLANYSTFD